MVRERYAFYSATFPSPLGNVSNCFFVADTADPPRVDGVPIPEKDYDARAVIELDFSVCSPHVATSILCKSLLFATNKQSHNPMLDCFSNPDHEIALSFGQGLKTIYTII